MERVLTPNVALVKTGSDQQADDDIERGVTTVSLMTRQPIQPNMELLRKVAP